ncbi:hypothetical protein BDN72DRAFT_959219 [Pluteus cervinus]|uniref:Uncharacterized protein n=1 Tax=Pluteus cervinus TaxID=181527 RepID=A0ACD3AVV6_9AGAR|nr:hypothetical protein BDN72DRAFT_959219 [Pluteus cervinus]
MSRCSTGTGTTISYPDNPPETVLGHAVNALGKENFEADRYAYIDALITFSLFFTHLRSDNQRALPLDDTLDLGCLAITEEEGSHIYQTCHRSIPKDQPLEPTRQSCRETASSIQEKFPRLFEETDVEIMTGLLLRYFLSYSEDSPVRVRKTTKTGDDGVRTLCAELKAIRQIPALTYILSANGLVSSNEAESGGLFILQGQPGTAEKRLILGPFRFLHHDCQPNCQILPVPDSRACTLRTLREIRKGETLTVSYTADVYLEPPGPKVGECRCASCCPDNPPGIPKSDSTDLPDTSASTGTKKRRRHTRRAKRGSGQNRAKRKRLEQETATDEPELEDGEVQSDTDHPAGQERAKRRKLEQAQDLGSDVLEDGEVQLEEKCDTENEEGEVC